MFLLIISILLISGCTTQEKYTIIFNGVELHFRGDLNRAVEVPVFPHEKLIPKMVLNKEIEKITIAIPNTTSAGYYAVAGYEIAFKLTFIYNSIYSPFSNPEILEKGNYTCLYYKDFNKRVCIGKFIFNDEKEIKRTQDNEIVLALLGEGFANSTEIILNPEDGIIFIKGKSFSLEDRNYTDLDLATDKFLLVLFEYLSDRRI